MSRWSRLGRLGAGGFPRSFFGRVSLRAASVTAKASISAGLIWLVLRDRDPAALLNNMLGVDTVALALAITILGVLIFSLALRWSVILGAMGYPRSPRITFPLVLIGLFFNQALPSSIGGDAVRIWFAYKAGLSGAVAVSSVVLDRLLGILALLLLVTAAMPQLFGLAQNPVPVQALLLVLGLALLGFAALMVLDRVPLQLKRFRIVRMFGQFAADLRKVLLSRRWGSAVLALGLLNQIASVLVVLVIARGLGLEVGLGACLLIVPLANLVQALPISIAGWGVREGFFVVAFGMVGIEPTQALALSVLYGLLHILVSLPGGICWLAYGRGRPSELPLVPR